MENISKEETYSNDFVIQGPQPIYEPGRGGLGYEIFRSLNLNRGKTAQIFASNGITVSYETLLLRSTRAAIYLSKKKLTKGEIVCLCSSNHKDSIVPFIASTFAGITYASIDPFLYENDVIYLLNYIKPRIMFVSEEFEAKIETYVEKSAINCEFVIFGKSVKNSCFSDIIVPSEEEKKFQPVFVNDLKETVVIFLSSGTTGYSKGICLNHYSLLSQAFNSTHYNYRQGTFNLSNFSRKYDDKKEMKFLFHSPMEWITGTIFSLILIFSGGTRIVGSIFNAENTWDVIEKFKPNTMFFPPAQAQEICLYAMDKVPNNSLDVFIIYGAGVTEDLLKNIKKQFPKSKIVQAYGQTENAGLMTAFNIDDPEDVKLQEMHSGSSGRPVPTFKMKVVDPHTEKNLPIGMHGELRIKSSYIMNGYYQMNSSEAFDSNGWFKTGDLVFFDEDNCLHIIDRLKDIFEYGKHWVHPSVIEKILSQHHAVLENFVFGYPNPKDTGHAMAVVVLREEYKNKVDCDEIISFVNERVPNESYKIRAGIKFIDQMLKTPTGKIKKMEMKRSIITKQI